MSIQGKLGAIYRGDQTASVAFTDEATTADAAYKRYKITAKAKRYFDDSVAVTVKKNGTVQTLGFTIEYAGGVVVFTNALLGTDVVTVSGKYFNVVQCAGMFDWKLDPEVDTKEVTTFSSNGWKEFLSSLKSWAVSASGYWADGSFIAALGSRIILCLYVDNSNDKRYEGYIVLKKNSVETPVDDVIKETLDIQGSGPLYYHDV